MDTGAQALILATTNAHVKALNEAARAAWKDAGLVRGKEHVFDVTLRDGTQEERTFQKGDRILFTKNDRDLRVKNGQFGTVDQIIERGQASGAQVKVTLDEGREVSFGAKAYTHIEHGYASTVYKAQGSTIDRVFVAHAPGMGREAAYVAMSRHRKCVEVFVSREAFDTDAWKTLHERPVGAKEKAALLEAQLNAIVAKAAKEMERAQEKAMSVEFAVKGKAVEIVNTQENKQTQSIEQKPEKTKGRSRGMSLGL